MRTVAVFIAVMAVGIVQLYVAGPLGLSWDLGRHSVAAAAFIGGMIGVVALVLVGPALIERVTSFFRWLFRRPKSAAASVEDVEPESPGRFARLVDRLGAPFLGIVGPLTIGGWAAALLGRANGIGKFQLIAWLALGQALVTASYVYTIAELTD